MKFRVGSLVYLAFARDETMMGFAFPKEERAALIEAEPHKFLLPKPSDLRYNWVVVRLGAIDRPDTWPPLGPLTGDEHARIDDLLAAADLFGGGAGG